MEEQLVRYLLDDLPADERAAVDARITADPAEAARLTRLRHVIEALSADHDSPEPPPGLALAAITRTAESIVADGTFDPEVSASAEWLLEPPLSGRRPIAGRAAAAWRRWVGGDPVFLPAWQRADMIVAACVGFLAVGVGLSAIGKLRYQNQVLACQENMRGLHTALVGYSDTHSGRFPQVGTPTVPVAGAFPTELVRSGQLWSPTGAVCPIPGPDGPAAPPASYSYTLGYRDPSGLVLGLRRGDVSDSATDWTPIAADVAGPAGSPHKAGQNVLFVGGGVRFATTPTVGPAGDDIYRNDDGFVRAGLHRLDASLGTAADVP